MMPNNVNDISGLDFRKQLTLAYLTCERLYPNYVYFANNFNFGSPQVLRKAIDYIHKNLFSDYFDRSKITSLIQELYNITPQPALFDTGLASAALDACGAIVESLNFMLDRNLSRLKAVTTMATDTVDMHIQDIGNLDFNTDPEFQNKIDTHPLMQNEKAIQLGILKFLSSRTTLDYDDVHTLLELQQSDKKGNLAL